MLGSAAMLMGYSYPLFTVGLTTASVAGSNSSSTVTSTSVTATRAGGSGQVDVAWEYVSGNAAIVATAPNQPTTAFQATGMAVGSIGAVWRASVRDKVTGELKYTGNVSVYLERGYPALSGSVSGAHQTGNASTVINITAGASASGSGGVPPYSYSWGGGGGFSVSPSGGVCYYGVALGPGQSASASGAVTITDSIGQSVTLSFPITCANTGTAPAPLTAWVDKSSLSAFSNGASASTSEASTGYYSGGIGPFSSGWVRTGGSGYPTGGGSSSGFACDGIPAGGSLSGSFAFVVTDHGNGGAQASAGVSVVFYNFGIGGGPIN